MHRKQKNVYQQTQALLYKNLLKKWRMKRESLLEWGFPILLGLYMGLFSYLKENTQFPEKPPEDLGRVDKFNDTYILVYMPISNRTEQIMNKTASIFKGATIIGVSDQNSMDKILLDNFLAAVGIVFSDTLFYKLKFFQGHGIPFMKEEHFSAHCWKTDYHSTCSLAKYLDIGFVTLQTAINAAIIEIMTNHSVMEELMSVTVTNMKTLPFISKDVLQNEMFVFYCLLYFSSFIYFASLGVTKERKKSKDLMTMMGLQDSAFWFSWSLIYAGFIFIISIIIAVIITSTKIIVMTGFMVMFTLFFLYGLSLVALAFLMSVLLNKTVLTTLVVFLFTLFWGAVGLSALYKQLPSSLEWVLSIFSPFAFTAGMGQSFCQLFIFLALTPRSRPLVRCRIEMQIIHLDYNMSGVTFPDPSGDSYIMIATFFMLAFDASLYFVLALYFDRIFPYGSDRRYSPLFFLSSSSCFQHQRTDNIIEKEIDTEYPSNDNFEPIASEFHGKEVIRIINLRKEYKEKSGKVEVLKGLLFDVYEGQITAVMGHSGAGKSSLLNILNGLSVPTEGSVTIYNKNLSEMQDLEEIRKITGVCPQFNIHFDILTVKENLRLFAKIKGIHPQGVDQEVERILLELDLQNIQDHPAKHLSEGQKRKLTFGIAILGDPQVLLLDEPTAGLDPFARHRVWSFLKERKAGRVILLSTNLVDEADILADRKVIMSNGRLKCAGSSIFLKKKWGLGYHLSLYRNEICDPEKITSIINHHIPDAKLKTESKENLVYTLPMERTNKFPDLFSDLDEGSGQGVMSYDISMSTLNEVFMKVEGISTIEQEMSRDSENLYEMEPAYSSRPEIQKTVSDLELWRRQVCAIARLRFLKLRHGKKALLILLLVLGIALFPVLVEVIFDAVLVQRSDWEFKPELYFLSPGQLPQDPLSSLLIINNTESNIEDFIQSLKHQNILLEIDDFKNRNSSEELSYNGAIIVSGKQKDYRFAAVCNTKRLHCFPILMGIISNGLLRMFNHTQQIRIARSSYPFNFVLTWTGLPEASFFLFSVVSCISPYFAMSSVSDYKKGAKAQLWVSGLYPSAYWCGQALVDISLFVFILLIMYIIFYTTFIVQIYITSQIMFALVIITFGYAASLIFLTYVISFIFGKRRKNSGFWSFCFYISSINLVETLMFKDLYLPATIWGMIFIPQFALDGFVVFVTERIFDHQRENEGQYSILSGVDLLVCLIPYLQALLFIFVLRCLEIKYGQKIMQKDPIFRISPQRREAQAYPEEPVDEDEDVQAERRRTATALTTTDLEENPVIIASCLHKNYAGQKKNCFSKRKKKVATRNLSFCVKKGEILGLLGPNGAGKSSSVRMVSGVTDLTAGKVELRGYSSAGRYQGDGTVKFLGYCPQEDALWPNLTVRQHLEVFAAVKGLRKADAAITIARLVGTFKMHKLLNVPVQKLTAGATRKLGFVLSILGNSPILLLDEPCTGMDPIGQQQMWRMIQEVIKNTEKGALLTTHYLAEAEAICDRIAVMVSGRLRCIGSIQRLKSKLCKDYILELKVKEISQETLVHTEILKLFPQAARQERYSSSLTYKLPVVDVHPLSQAFRKLEAVNREFDLEEYGLSQCSLEKAILELFEEQYEGNCDEEADTTMRWKLLSHSDDP